MQKRLRLLILACLLSASGVSASGISFIAGLGTTPTVNIQSVPGLAQALRAHHIVIHRHLTVTKHTSQPAIPVVIKLSASPQTLPLGFPNLLPGNPVTRSLAVTNAGNTTFKQLIVHVSANPVVPLVSNSTQGLQVSIGGTAVPLSSAIANSIVLTISIKPGQTYIIPITLSLPLLSTLAGESTTLTWQIEGLT